MAYAPRILIVEDDASVRRLFEHVLSEDGYYVTSVGTGRHALLVLRDVAFDAVIVDMSLPDLDGPEALQALRELPGSANMPAIAISGMDEHDARHILTKDFAEYLTKPIDLDVLQSTVARHLGEDRARSVAN